jgi:hypothetical protein
MKPHPIFKSKLKEKTRILLAENLKLKAQTYEHIAKETGLSATWVAMFSRGELKHTDVGRVETLYNYLSTAPLNV